MSHGNFVDVKKVASWGYFHLLKAPFGAAEAKERCLNEKRLICHRGGCGTGTILADAFTAVVRMMKSVQ
jgi:hypothetical protein